MHPEARPACGAMGESGRVDCGRARSPPNQPSGPPSPPYTKCSTHPAMAVTAERTSAASCTHSDTGLLLRQRPRAVDRSISSDLPSLNVPNGVGTRRGQAGVRGRETSNSLQGIPPRNGVTGSSGWRLLAISRTPSPIVAAFECEPVRRGDSEICTSPSTRCCAAVTAMGATSSPSWSRPSVRASSCGTTGPTAGCGSDGNWRTMCAAPLMAMAMAMAMAVASRPP